MNKPAIIPLHATDIALWRQRDDILGDGMIQRFCAHMRYRGMSQATIRRRRATLHAFAKFVDPSPLSAVSAEEIESFLLAHHAPRTRHAYRSDLRVFYAWLATKGIIDASPAAKLERVIVPRTLPRPISIADAEEAMRLAGRRTRQMIALGLYAGLRAGEIAALQAEDVWLHGTPPVIVVRNGKGGKDRSVPIHPALHELLSTLPSAGPVFRAPGGGSVRPNSVSAVVGKHLRRCGINATCHQLRHTFGTEAAAASGGDVVAVAELMGHANTDTTMGYVRLTAGRAAALVESMYQPSARVVA